MLGVYYYLWMFFRANVVSRGLRDLRLSWGNRDNRVRVKHNICDTALGIIAKWLYFSIVWYLPPSIFYNSIEPPYFKSIFPIFNVLFLVFRTLPCFYSSLFSHPLFNWLPPIIYLYFSLSPFSGLIICNSSLKSFDGDSCSPKFVSSVLSPWDSTRICHHLFTFSIASSLPPIYNKATHLYTR